MDERDKKPARSRKKWINTLLIAAIAGCVLYWIGGSIISQANAKRIPDVTLHTLAGQPYALQQSAGKIRLLELIYTRCPDICPTTTVKMVQLQQKLKQDGLFGDRVEFVTVTIDPQNDTPEAMQKYAEKLGIDQNGWLLVRDSPEATKAFTDALGFYVKPLDDGLMSHSTITYLIGPDNRIEAKFGMGDSMDTDQLYAQIVKLSKDGT
ncbi:MAG: SCO family protein [Clostridia bacterium]